MMISDKRRGDARDGPRWRRAPLAGHWPSVAATEATEEAMAHERAQAEHLPQPSQVGLVTRAELVRD